MRCGDARVATMISVVLPTHNPHRARLGRTIDGLRTQTLSAERWELIVVDNASSPPVTKQFDGRLPGNSRVIAEPSLGLSSARRRGFLAAKGDIIVLVDDDNVLDAQYLERVQEIFVSHPRIGAAGGRSVPEFEATPPEWIREFDDLLACRDLGDVPIVSDDPGRNPPERYPKCAPIGAGMAIRREAALAWLEQKSDITDRRGAELSSGGDNDIVLSLLRAGWQVGYFPQLRLTHLIPAQRAAPDYLARLNEGIQRSWVRVLAAHGACPWRPIPRYSVPFRAARLWWRTRAWRDPAARVRYHGLKGRLLGQADLA
jgi:glycosyltransferase involved in cell wall biosynthesis